jgi:gallate dioxygenase
MAQIIGALASSHTPTIGFALDRDKRDDPAWAPIFEHFEPLRQWLADKKPDVLVIIFNDHVTSFFFDHYSAFTLGIGEKFPVADEGGGARDLAPAIGHPALARHIGQALMADEFDMSFFQDKPLDHGLFSPHRCWPAGMTTAAGRRGSSAARRGLAISPFRRRGAATSSGSRCGGRSRVTRRT